jgi:cadmium resistance protein CadD (predicted permease)
MMSNGRHPPRRVRLIIALALAAFVSTNVDDLSLLTLWFLKRTSLRTVLLGQAAGFTVLVLASMLGYLGTMALARSSVHWLGLLPIAIGIKQLLSTEQDDDQPADSWWTVATLTVANGGDNVAVYVPLFSRYNMRNVELIIFCFYVSLCLWVVSARFAARKLARNDRMHRIAHRASPFVIMLIGGVILFSD